MISKVPIVVRLKLFVNFQIMRVLSQEQSDAALIACLGRATRFLASFG